MLGVGLSTGSDSELITQCLSLPPPSEFRLRSAEILRSNSNHVSDQNGNEQSNGANYALSVEGPIKRKQSAFNLSGQCFELRKDFLRETLYQFKNSFLFSNLKTTQTKKFLAVCYI